METLDARESAFIPATYAKLRELCRLPIHGQLKTGAKSLISDSDIEEIAQCLRDLKEDEASERPRTYAVLHMMGRQDLLPVFVASGLRDNSFPYPDRRALPPRMSKYEPDACHWFLEFQAHIMSPALELERMGESPHIVVESGDLMFQYMERLGKGGDAKVDKVRSKITGKIYARKRMYRHKDFNRNKDIMDRFINEVQILKKLDHDHLVKIIGSYTDAKSVAIIMIPVADRDLKQYLRSCSIPLRGLERSRFRTYYGCLASALAYLHENGIRHKDIKPNNILLKGDIIYITDFGTAIEFDGDSVTKGTVRVKTNQYQSPEVARGSKRGTASDIWSLGVTFLEMTTILRGETLDSMQKFLVGNGSKEEYVFENISGAIQWIGYLSKNTKLPRTDNAPMQWIKDMLGEKSKDRPSAEQLLENIKQVYEGEFCCKWCRADGSTVSDLSSDEERDDDDTLRSTIPPKQSNDSTQQSRPMVGRENNQKDKIPVKQDPIKSTLDPRASPLHKQVMSQVFGYFPNFSMPRLRSYRRTPQVVKEDPVPAQIVSPEVKLLVDPYACHLPGSFPDYDSFENESSETTDPKVDGENEHNQPEVLRKIDNQSEVAAATHYTRILKKSSTSKYTRVLKGPVVYTYSLNPENIPVVEDLGHGHGSGDPAQGIDHPKVGKEDHVMEGTAKAVESPVNEEVLPVEDWLFNPGPRGFIVKISGAMHKSSQTLQNWLRQPSTRQLQRSRSDENLEIQRQTKCILENHNPEHNDALLSSFKRRLSDSIQQEEIESGSKPAIFAELRAFKPQLQNIQIPSESPTPTSESIQDAGLEDESTLPTNANSQVFPEESIQEPLPMPEGSAPTESNIPKEEGHTQKLPSAAAQQRSAAPTTNVSPKKNPLLNWFQNARGLPNTPKVPGTSRLTGENLGRLNAQTNYSSIHEEGPASRTSPPRFKVERASVYMRKVFDDAASSVPTSVMSTKTREKFKLAGLMLPLQDRTNNYLGQYTKLGKADAVRMLLREGCCPGTKAHPRPGPIFDVVRGASSRHTKCLRALINHGVDVNVRRNGKTPLIEAVEQEPWSGYVTVIYLLLLAGANPNAKDGSGDSPLLKLLGGGLRPLEEHHRKALALLLSPSWKTNVKVTPLGTQNKPLHLAIRRNDPYAVGMLLDKDDSVIEAENSEGLTPLLLAARSWTTDMSSDQLEILDLLLEKKANSNVKMLRTDKTPLHIAVSHGLIHAVERLLEHGSDPMLSTRDGKTVFDIANERKY
ncbi:hypothetical protein EG329_002605 [Mollisiaceae sp. DMI_Dod_QoI]|nr:hypothetical protein EG329_002605 [Helotiales sp. DMI_Dod_QoI]